MIIGAAVLAGQVALWLGMGRFAALVAWLVALAALFGYVLWARWPTPRPVNVTPQWTVEAALERAYVKRDEIGAAGFEQMYGWCADLGILGRVLVPPRHAETTIVDLVLDMIDQTERANARRAEGKPIAWNEHGFPQFSCRCGAKWGQAIDEASCPDCGRRQRPSHFLGEPPPAPSDSATSARPRGYSTNLGRGRVFPTERWGMWD